MAKKRRDLSYDEPITDLLDDLNPLVLDRATAIADRLVQTEGYSEEQAYQIALERAQEEMMGPRDEILNEEEDLLPGMGEEEDERGL